MTSRRFFVRTIAPQHTEYGDTEYDVLFADREEGVWRYSEYSYGDRREAEALATEMERGNERPRGWNLWDPERCQIPIPAGLEHALELALEPV